MEDRDPGLIGPDETAYRLERSLDGTSGWAEVATVGQNVTSYSDTDLVPSTTYFYRVVALNSGGESSPSPTVTGGNVCRWL